MVICEKIRKARISRGLSQSDAATAAGMDTARFTSYEQGIMTPDTNEQILLSQALGVSFYYLRNDGSDNPNDLAWVQEGLIEFYQRFGNEALMRYERKLKEVYVEKKRKHCGHLSVVSG